MKKSSISDSSTNVVVRFRTNPDWQYEDNLHLKLKEFKSDFWRLLCTKFGDLSVERLFKEQTAVELLNLEKRAADLNPDAKSRIGTFTSLFSIRGYDESEANAIAEMLADWELVEEVDMESFLSDDEEINDCPIVTAQQKNQKYLGEAPGGVEAKFAWSIPGGRGANQTLVDYETGWTLDHDSFKHLGITKPFCGGVKEIKRPHGTAVLGICAGKGASKGIAPDIDLDSGVTSMYPDSLKKAKPIVDLAGRLEKGDILLIELESRRLSQKKLPFEDYLSVRTAIRNIVDLGVIVVEAAGNGSQNLKGYPHIHACDSGAIIVAASNAYGEYCRHTGSNFGSRVNCFAWGEEVYTAVSYNEGDTSSYCIFDGTSSAAAIVAGCALSLQGAYEAKHKERLCPAKMRSLLSDPIHNTCPDESCTVDMGVMPNLRNLILNAI